MKKITQQILLEKIKLNSVAVIEPTARFILYNQQTADDVREYGKSAIRELGNQFDFQESIKICESSSFALKISRTK